MRPAWYWLKHVLHSRWLCVTSRLREMWFVDCSCILKCLQYSLVIKYLYGIRQHIHELRWLWHCRPSSHQFVPCCCVVSWLENSLDTLQSTEVSLKNGLKANKFCTLYSIIYRLHFTKRLYTRLCKKMKILPSQISNASLVATYVVVNITMWGVYVFFISPLALWFWSHHSAASPPGLSISVSVPEPPRLFLLASSHETGVREGGLRAERERLR